jgi:hypothetical protein
MKDGILKPEFEATAGQWLFFLPPLTRLSGVVPRYAKLVEGKYVS